MERILEEHSHEGEYMFIGIAVLMIVFIAVGVFLESRHIKMIHESIVILVLSIAFTLVFSSATGTKISSAIQPGVIFSYLLPPIILAAGFNMRKKFFFKNIGYIGMFGFLGTLINFFVVCTAFYFINQIVGGIVGNYLYDNIDPEKSGQRLTVAMKMAATLIATDTIAPLTLIDDEAYPTLFSIIFGEGISNDAVALILMTTVLKLDNTSSGEGGINFKMLGNFFANFGVASFLSIVFGFVAGAFSCFIHKSVKSLINFPILETSLIFLMAMACYAIAEVIGLAAIVSIFIFGIVQSHYNRYNLSYESVEKAGFVFGLVSYLCEAFILIYLGLSFDQFGDNSKGESIITYAVVDFFILLVSRLIVVFGLTIFAKSCIRKGKGISLKEALLVSVAGLIRGAIAYALISNLFSEGHDADGLRGKIVALCQLIIIVTIFIFTPLNTAMFKCLLGGDKSHHKEPHAITESLLDDEKKRKMSIKDTLKKLPESAKQTKKEGIAVTYSDRNELIDSKKKIKYCKRCDEFFMKPLLIRDYEKRQDEKDVHEKQENGWSRNTMYRGRPSLLNQTAVAGLATSGQGDDRNTINRERMSLYGSGMLINLQKNSIGAKKDSNAQKDSLMANSLFKQSNFDNFDQGPINEVDEERDVTVEHRTDLPVDFNSDPQSEINSRQCSYQ